jgi:plasmid stability protein
MLKVDCNASNAYVASIAEVPSMAALTIRNLNDTTKQELRLRAARRGASMEDEARLILRLVVEAGLSLDELSSKKRGSAGDTAWEGVRALREKYGALDLELPDRTELAGTHDIFAAD